MIRTFSMLLIGLGFATSAVGQTRLHVVDPLRRVSEDPAVLERIRDGEEVRLVIPRNGVASAQVVVASDRPLPRVQARLSNLVHESGQVTMPATLATLRYATRHTSFDARGNPLGEPETHFDGLLDQPRPGERVQPVWITLALPPQAPPGTYRGQLQVAPGGIVPVVVEVSEWAAPSPAEFETHVSLLHSPETIARHYGVALWSPEHIRLTEPSLRMLGQVGNKVLYLPLVAETHFGNEETMVRVTRIGRTAPWTPDFAPLERYLTASRQAMGEPRAICLYLWEPAWARRPPEHLGVTSVERGRTDTMEAPYFGQPGSEAFWRPILEGVRDRVARLGWNPERIMIGVAEDARPSAEIVGFFDGILPGVRWTMFTHGRGDPRPDGADYVVDGVPVGWLELPYRPDLRRYDPNRSLGLGWRRALPTVTSLRSFDSLDPSAYRNAAAWAMSSDRYTGFTRIGLDFWPIDGRPLIGRTHRWHNLYRFNPRWFVIPGPEGAAATVRFEMLREGVQEAEAVIRVERATMDRSSPLSAEQRREARQLMDERMQALMPAIDNWDGFAGSGWADRAARLFALAAQIDAATAR